jgi:hypothetical protein
MARRERTFEEVAEKQRTTKDEAGREGIGIPEPGVEFPARSYPDPTGVADLGVDEPVLNPPVAENDPGPGSRPTGWFAGETEADRQEEGRLRHALEEEFPSSRGSWKEGGQVPSRGRADSDDYGESNDKPASHR